MEKKKHPGGRPTVYKPEYCEMLIQHMKEGLSFEAFGGVTGHSKQTLYEWIEKFPEFGDSKRRGELLSQLWWEKIGVERLISQSWHQGGSKALNASVWIFNMKNRFGWRDRHDIEHTGDIGVSPKDILELMKKNKTKDDKEEG